MSNPSLRVRNIHDRTLRYMAELIPTEILRDELCRRGETQSGSEPDPGHAMSAHLGRKPKKQRVEVHLAQPNTWRGQNHPLQSLVVDTHPLGEQRGVNELPNKDEI